MPMCAYGKALYDEWWESANLADVLDAKQHRAPLPGTPTDLMYVELYRRARVARSEFIQHRGFCIACQEDAFVD
jgi:hypothetical protein